MWFLRWVLLFGSSWAGTGSVPPDTLTFRFERILVTEGSAETTRGEVFFSSPHTVLIEVGEPVRQVMWINDNLMLLYYPDHKRVLRMQGEGPIDLPFVQGVLGSLREDWGLAHLGYVPAATRTHGDVVYGYWDPPSEAKKKLGRIIIGTRKGALVSTTIMSPSGDRTIAKATYSRHQDLNGWPVPTEVHSELWVGKRRSTESLRLDDLKADVPLPERVRRFTPPASVPVEDVSWP